MLNTGVSGETRRPIDNENPFEEKMFRGDINVVPTLKLLLDASSPGASTGVANNLPGLRPILDTISGGCKLGGSDTRGDA